MSRLVRLTVVAVALVALASCGGGGSSSAPVPPSASLMLMALPNVLNILPNSTVTFQVTATAAGESEIPKVTLTGLPAGMTATTPFPLAVPAAGAAITLQAAASLKAGSYTLVLNGQAGSASGTATVPLHVKGGSASFYFTGASLTREFNVPNGGSSQAPFGSATDYSLSYDIALSVTGLPPGVTATITPSSILPGQNTTVTLHASADAPWGQNVPVTLVGTPQAPVPAASIEFIVEVNHGPGSLPNNRTDYLSTEGTPYGAVYDPLHGLIFASNPSWNRVDVIAVSSHTFVKHIPIRSPRGIDITQDDSKVWVATNSQQVFGIDTTSLAATTYNLPRFSPYTNVNWQGSAIFALADGTVALTPTVMAGGTTYLVIWDPNTNTLASHASPTGSGFGYFQRTGDGKRLYSIDGSSADNAFYYDVLTASFSPVQQVGSYAIAFAVNFDGSRLVIFDYQLGLNMYDGDFNLIGPLPGGGFSMAQQFQGGLLFSSDNQRLYEVCLPGFTPFVLTIDTASLNVTGIAPAMPMIPVSTELQPPFYMAEPFAITNTGLLLGIQYYGIAFDDATFVQDYSLLQPGTPIYLQHMSPYAGPLEGGTVSGGFGNAFSLTPDVWYGAQRGTAHVDSSGLLTITSPPASAPGPVNLKFLFPDGVEVFDPLFFSYGPSIQSAAISAAGPQGGASGEIAGYGLPTSSSGGSIVVGGNPAPITSSGNIPLFMGTSYPFPANTVNFRVPPGSPGWTSITATTPSGTTTLPKSFYYARSVTDYSAPDTLTDVLYDGVRQQLYLSAGNHIDVFSLASMQFVAQLTPAAQGTNRQFAGMALTPGGLLLAADLLDGTLAVIDPDNPANTYYVFVTSPIVVGQGCTEGPLYVAATSNYQAFVSIGGPQGTGCGPTGSVYQVDLPSRTSTFSGPMCRSSGTDVQASNDGSKVAIGGGHDFCIFNVAQQAYNSSSFYGAGGGAISGDGKIAASQWTFLDSAANLTGELALPAVYYGGLNTAFYALPHPRLNDAGSLYYIAYSNFFDIVDVEHGALRMRFSLAETVSNTAAAMAIDSDGRHIYLVTNKGLTIVDLGSAPLSIGWLSQSVAGSGTQITVRGSGFNASTQATVGGMLASTTYVDSSTLNFVVPPAKSGSNDLMLTNSDGTSYKLENGLIVR